MQPISSCILKLVIDDDDDNQRNCEAIIKVMC